MPSFLFLPGKSIPRVRDVHVPNPCSLPLPLPMTVIAGCRSVASLTRCKGGEAKGFLKGLSWLGMGADVASDSFTDYIMYEGAFVN